MESSKMENNFQIFTHKIFLWSNKVDQNVALFIKHHRIEMQDLKESAKRMCGMNTVKIHQIRTKTARIRMDRIGERGVKQRKERDQEKMREGISLCTVRFYILRLQKNPKSTKINLCILISNNNPKFLLLEMVKSS